MTRCLSLALVLLSSCAAGIDWQRHLAVRAYGSGLQLSEIDPDEMAKAAVRPQLDYVSLSVERVFFREVPGALTGAGAVGLEVTGRAPGDRPVKTVLGVKSIRADRTIQLDETIAIQPTLYTGRNVGISLHFRRIPGKEAQNALGRIQGVSDLLKKIDPSLPRTLETGLSIFQQVIEGPATAKEPLWTYQTTFLPASGAIRDKPDRIFTAARHILILLPPAGTAGAWGKLTPDALRRYLRVDGNRLVWRHTGLDYEATPYIMLNVRRYRRYPKETEVEKHLRRADVLYEQGPRQGFFMLGRIALMNAAEAAVKDQVLTSEEKNLIREWIQFRHRRFDAEEARAKADKKTQLEHQYGQIRALGVIRQEFQKILYPFEVRDIEYKVATLYRQTKELATELGEPVARLDELLEVYKLKERVVEVLKTRYRDRVIRVHTPDAEQFGAPPGEPGVVSAGDPDPKIVDIAASALAAPPPDVRDLEKGISAPWYRSWWFWTAVGAAVVGASAGYYYGIRPEHRGGTGLSSGPFVPLPRSKP